MNATSFQFETSSIRQLEGALQQYRRVSQRSDEYIVNKALRNVAMRSVRHTIQADRGKLAAELGATYTGSGRSRRGSYAPTTVAFARFIAKCKREGLPIPSKAALAAAVIQFVKNTLRSVAFMRSGWRPSIDELSRLTHESAGDVRGVLGGKKGFGGSVPARNIGTAVSGEIFNASVSNKNATSEWALTTYAGPALEIAIAEEAADKWDYAEKQMDKNADEFNR